MVRKTVSEVETVGLRRERCLVVFVVSDLG